MTSKTKKKPLRLFFVSVLFLDAKDEKYIVRSHCLGFYETFKRAQRAVTRNEGDMYEIGYYNHAVIERYGPGIYFIPTEMQWYRVRHNSKKQFEPTVTKIQKPNKLRPICSFAM